jgi:hypothetical protein
MTRYFFDVVGHQRSELDYVGRMLLTAEEAYDAAEMMAFDLAVKLTDEVVGREVAVSDADGRKLFSILVKESYLTAMPAEWGVDGPTIRRARGSGASRDTAARRLGQGRNTRKMAA